MRYFLRWCFPVLILCFGLYSQHVLARNSCEPDAYTQTHPCIHGYWSTLPLVYCIESTISSDYLSASQAETTIQEGVNVWLNSGAAITAESQKVKTPNAVCKRSWAQDNQNNIFFEQNETTWNSRTYLGPQTLGVTWSNYYYSGSSVPNIAEADIALNNVHYSKTQNFDWAKITNSSVGYGKIDLKTIFTHEFGHFFGLSHNTDTQDALMWYTSSAQTPFPGLHSDDIEGAIYLYGGGTGGIGYTCSVGTECNSQICVTDTTPGYCTEGCSADSCPFAYECGTYNSNQVCVKKTKKAFCDECQYPSDCESGLCLGGLYSNYCSQTCNNSNPCPTDFECSSQQGIKFCSPTTANTCFSHNPNATQVYEGENCYNTANTYCSKGLECLWDQRDPANAMCFKKCTDTVKCSPGRSCAPVATNSGDIYLCLEEMQEGQDCGSILKTCQDGHSCLYNKNTLTQACFKECNNNNSCADSQTCDAVSFTDGSKTQLCRPPIDPDTLPQPEDDAKPDEDGGVTQKDDSVIRHTGEDDTTHSQNGHTNPKSDDTTNTSSDDTDTRIEKKECSCDLTLCCDENCACDPECFNDNCACDTSNRCDPECPCDPDCLKGCQPKKGCSCEQTLQQNTTPILPGLLIIFACIFFLYSENPRRKRHY